MKERDHNNTLTLPLETWCEFVDMQSEGSLATATFRLEGLSLFEGAERAEPTESQVSEWTGHTITGTIGKGGMGVVHKATQDQLQRTIALKTPNTPRLNRRFIEEALVSGYLNHPNIITVHNLLNGKDNSLGLTMPLIEGLSWNDKLKNDYAQNNGTLSAMHLRDHLDHLIKVCQAISYAHHKGLLHNDLKLENIMVGDFGDVVVMDWGCSTQNPAVDAALPFDVLDPKTLSRPFGSPAYMPPELARGDGTQIGPWSDTYMLGAMLYEIVEGKPPRSGKTVGDVVELACLGVFNDFEHCTSTTLQTICRKAMHPNITERYQTPEDVEDAVRGFFQAEQSETLLQAVQEILDIERKTATADSQEILVSLIEAVSMTQQANQIWPSSTAQHYESTTTRCLIQRAIEVGDLDLASAYLRNLSEEHKDLQVFLDTARKQRNQELEAFRRNTSLTRLVVIFVLLGLSVGGFLINESKMKAVEQHALAEDRLRELTSLSDIHTIKELRTNMNNLWPLRIDTSMAMEQWLLQTKNLVARKNTHTQHLDALSAANTDLNAQLLSWEKGIVSELIDEIDEMQRTHIPEIEARLEFSKSLEERSIDNYSEQWKLAIDSIATLQVYNGLRLSPQLGLIPLQQDPDSGLWEFGHLQSGTLPTIVDGEYVLTSETGIVLVLLPGSDFWMGAEKTGDKNVDLRAKDTEGPVHLVNIESYFLSKYELTQAQWLRINEHNHAAYPVGTEVEPALITSLHPMEQITWEESTEVMRRYDLRLPTEAQWEYATRGVWTPLQQTPSSNTVFWSGNTVASLQGTLNISDQGGRDLGSPESWRFESILDDGHIVHAPVGSFTANPFGLHDMLGNVWEWCADQFGEYTLPVETGTGKRQVTDPDASRLFRGGGFRASSVHVRSADRYSIYASDYRAYDVGVRPARGIE